MLASKPTYRVTAMTAIVLLILAVVFVCSWVALYGLIPPTVDKSGRSLLSADYRPWRYASIIDLNIPGLATAAARGAGEWGPNNLPQPTNTEQATSLPTPTAQPTSVPPTATPQQVFVPRPSTATAAPTQQNGGGVCGSPCSTSADCAGLACFAGVCWDNNVCGGGSGDGSNDGGNNGGGSSSGSDGGCTVTGVNIHCP